MDADLNLSDPKGTRMSTFVWFLLVVLYLTALIVLGLTTLRKGHTALFWFGIIFPILWIVGAVMAPTPAATAAEAPTGAR
jgi:vacuolar-type H+-ATPase subunit I/STV1